MRRGCLSLALLFGCLALSNACRQEAPPAQPPATPAPATGGGSKPATDPQGQTGSVPAKGASTATEPETGPKSAVPAKPASPEARAQDFVDALADGEFEKATGDFDETMSKVMPAAKLKEMWNKLETQSGKFQKRRATRLEQSKIKDVEYNFAFVTCEFEKTALDAKLVSTRDGKITGLFFVPPKPAFVGKEELWLGTLDAGGVKLRLLVHVGKTAEGKYLATLDSLDQGQKGIPFDDVTYQDGTVRLEATAVKVVFEGKIDETGKELSGEWRQGGMAFPLTLKQVDSEPQVRRPQTPKRPFPYDEIEVAYESFFSGARFLSVTQCHLWQTPQGS